jgi:signal transduction histidine kinase
VVRRVFDLVMPEAREHVVQLSTDLSDSLPDVMGDEGQLGQALLNMMVNAFQAVSGPGQVLAVTDVESASGRVRLSLSDSGCGIDKEELDRVFEPYYTTKAEGTGLGLAIAQRIVLDHGGRMEVESAPGAGATFRILLPPAGRQSGPGDG